jgi:hypothetical protein
MSLQAGHGDMRTILETRAAVEPTMAALAAERRTDRHLEALRTCVADLLACRLDDDRFHHENRRFHNLVADASGNLLLAAILPALSVMSQAAGWQLHEKVRRRVAKEKGLIVDAIEERSSWRASQRMSRKAGPTGPTKRRRPAAVRGRPRPLRRPRRSPGRVLYPRERARTDRALPRRLARAGGGVGPGADLITADTGQQQIREIGSDTSARRQSPHAARRTAISRYADCPGTSPAV